MICQHKIQTPAGMFPCQEAIEHEHMGAAEAPKTTNAQTVDLSEIWKEISRLQDIIKQLSNQINSLKLISNETQKLTSHLIKYK